MGAPDDFAPEDFAPDVLAPDVLAAGIAGNARPRMVARGVDLCFLHAAAALYDAPLSHPERKHTYAIAWPSPQPSRA